jgi:hypothetical protein
MAHVPSKTCETNFNRCVCITLASFQLKAITVPKKNSFLHHRHNPRHDSRLNPQPKYNVEKHIALLSKLLMYKNTVRSLTSFPDASMFFNSQAISQICQVVV